MTLWSRLRQWSYAPVLRIDARNSDATADLMLASLSDLTRKIEQAGQMEAPPPVTAPAEPSPAAPPGEGGLEKAFVIDLCNQVHRLARAAKPFQSAPGQESSRLNRGFELVRKVLQERGIEYVDMTGEEYHPDQTNFELLGDIQPMPALKKLTIVQCDRPLIRQGGKLIQPGKGTVGRPLDT